MLSFILIALFVSAAIGVGISLADSVLKLCNAWDRAKLDVANANGSSIAVNEGAVVMLRPRHSAAPPRAATPLAVAA